MKILDYSIKKKSNCSTVFFIRILLVVQYFEDILQRFRDST